MYTSLSADDSLLVLRRFVRLYGKPKSIHSDNGNNFVGADRELSEELKNINEEKYKSWTEDQGIRWHFQTRVTS